jgi:hypothetical protein
VFEKSAGTACSYRPNDPSAEAPPGARETFESLPTTAGPWSPQVQHGGPPAALLARSVERLSGRRRRCSSYGGESVRAAQSVIVGQGDASSSS